MYDHLNRQTGRTTPAPPGDAETGELAALRKFAARIHELYKDWERYPMLSLVKALLGAAFMDLQDETREEAEPRDPQPQHVEALVEFARSAKTAWDSLPELSDGKHLLGEALMELADKIREEAEPHEAEAALNRVWPDPQTPPPGKEAQE